MSQSSKLTADNGTTPKSLLGELNEFWFGFGSPVTLGLFRILLGFANLVNLIFLFIDFDAWFSERGYVPSAINTTALGAIERQFEFFGHTYELPFAIPRINLLELNLGPAGDYRIADPTICFALFLVLLVAALFTTVGLWTRISSIVLAIGVVTLQHRNILILHGGDSILRLAAIYMALAPSGAACSLDRLTGLWRGKAPPTPAPVSLWPQRVIQYNLALIYFTTWWGKMDGGHWRDGTAIWYTSHLNEFHKFWVPDFLFNPITVPILTYGTLAVELALGTIVFWKPARNTVLVLGLLLHGYIEYSMNIPLFAFGICSWYICFYEGDEISRWAKNVGDKLQNWCLNVTGPKPLEPGPSKALEAMDPFGLVKYQPQKGKDLAITDAAGRKKGLSALGWRMLGAFPLGFFPGLWRKLYSAAAKSE